jgi:hypothetical protein
VLSGANIRVSGVRALKAGVYNVSGRLVCDLSRELAGRGRARWNTGSAPSGVYLVRVEAKGKTLQRPLILIR